MVHAPFFDWGAKYLVRMILSSSHDRQPTWTLKVLGVCIFWSKVQAICQETIHDASVVFPLKTLRIFQTVVQQCIKQETSTASYPIRISKKNSFPSFWDTKSAQPSLCRAGRVWSTYRALYIHRSIGISFVTSEISTSAPGKRWHRISRDHVKRLPNAVATVPGI